MPPKGPWGTQKAPVWISPLEKSKLVPNIQISPSEKSIDACMYAHIWVCHVWHPDMCINAYTTWSHVSAYSLSLLLKSHKRSKRIVKCSEFAFGAHIPHKGKTQVLAVCPWYEKSAKMSKCKCLQLAFCTQILLIDYHYSWIMLINQENLGTNSKL